MDSAAQEVFHVAELFELILQELLPYDLLLHAQRVDKFWRGTITGSVKLRRKLFLAPHGGNVVCHGQFCEDSATYKRIWTNVCRKTLPGPVTVNINPFFSSIFKTCGSAIAGKPKHHQILSAISTDYLNQQKYTCLEMYITSPPAQCIYYYVYGATVDRTIHASDGKGVKVKDVLRRVYLARTLSTIPLHRYEGEGIRMVGLDCGLELCERSDADSQPGAPKETTEATET